MAVIPTFPGVYVHEIPSGVRTIVGVATSVAVFIGTARKGPMSRPVRCTSYLDFVRSFGEDPAGGQLTLYVRLFFLNGGTDCWVMRIANGAIKSAIDLSNEGGTPTLRLRAKDPGTSGDFIRAVVSYGGPQSESTFNLDVVRIEVDSSGRRTRKDPESWKNLSMDPGSPQFVVEVLKNRSKLVEAEDLGVAPSASGVSISGRAIDGAFPADWQPILGSVAARNRFQISVDGSRFVDANLSGVVVGTQAATATAIKAAIDAAFAAVGLNAITVAVSFVPGPGGGTNQRLQIASSGTGDVYIRPAPGATDLTASLMLGAPQGGIEISAHAGRRPAANGIVMDGGLGNLNSFADLLQSQLQSITLEGIQADGSLVAVPISLTTPVPPPSVVTTAPGDSVFTDALAGSLTDNSDGVREKLSLIAQRINSFTAPAGTTFRWKAEVWGSRLALLPGDVFDDNYVPVFGATAAAFQSAFLDPNVRYYSLGEGGLNLGEQSNGVRGDDGGKPIATDYDAAYQVIDKQVDLFNLMVLPPDGAVTPQSLYANASIFCQEQRAFLLMDPPDNWDSAQTASTDVDALRIGLVKDHSAIFFPRLSVISNGHKIAIGPTGALAGLYARIDSTRGVWKAPAGTEADLRGIVGLDVLLSDRENGILNPKGINALRVFPNGIVSWGARTMDGDDSFASEYKYVPIRRLALFIEESLYRGLKFAVFEPNDEPLYGQIRLSVGAFMNNLFRQGAFQGQTPREAYFVKCDRETTTDNDRNLGIVNILVGFAPLKPAEFVILSLQQMAGQDRV